MPDATGRPLSGETRKSAYWFRPTPPRYGLPVIRPIFVAALAAVLIVAVPVGSAAQSTPSRTTTLHVYLAFQAGGRLASNLKVIRRTRGECRQPSHVSLRFDAWRCFRGSGYYDPCFSNTGGPTRDVVCPKAPWSRQVALMRLSKPLPLNGNSTKDPLLAEPWGIVTTRGTRCKTIASGTISVAAMRVSYSCADGSYLVGTTRRAAQPWRIFQLRRKAPNDLTDVALASAWW